MTAKMGLHGMGKPNGKYVNAAGEQPASLKLLDTGLSIKLADEPPEVVPFSALFAGQIAQGEAECIGLPAQQDVRIYVSKGFLTATKAAIKSGVIAPPKRRWWWPLP